MLKEAGTGELVGQLGDLCILFWTSVITEIQGTETFHRYQGGGRMQIREKRKSCIHQLSPVDQSLDKGDGGAGHHGEEDAQEDPEQGDALRRMENECFRCTKTIPKTVLISSAAMHGDSMEEPLKYQNVGPLYGVERSLCH